MKIPRQDTHPCSLFRQYLCQSIKLTNDLDITENFFLFFRQLQYTSQKIETLSWLQLASMLGCEICCIRWTKRAPGAAVHSHMHVPSLNRTARILKKE